MPSSQMLNEISHSFPTTESFMANFYIIIFYITFLVWQGLFRLLPPLPHICMHTQQSQESDP